jgi:hypothetical protein
MGDRMITVNHCIHRKYDVDIFERNKPKTKQILKRKIVTLDGGALPMFQRYTARPAPSL